MEMLFQTMTMQGTEFSFAAIENKQCAILRDGVIVDTFPAGGELEIGQALRRYVRLVEQSGGARQPEPAEGYSTHPHAG